MSAERAKEKKSGGCLKAAGIGCGLVIVLLVVAGVLVALNLDAIRQSDWYKSASEAVNVAQEELHNMKQLREDLLRDYPSEDVLVRARVVGSSGADGSSHTLVVELANLEADGSGLDGAALAREIAVRVRTTYPTIERYDTIEVSFSDQRGGGGITFGTDREFSFRTDELPAPGGPSSPDRPAETR